MKWWENAPWRLIQTNLREIDLKDLEPERVICDLRSFHATVLMINAGGISASYPTKLPWQYQNPLANHDGLKRVVMSCHENGIRVIARVDFSKVHEELYALHPQWAFRTADQQVMNYNGFVQTCPNSAYQQEYALRTLREIFETIPFDGLYCNMGGFQTRDYSFRDYGFCHCETCRRRFQEMSGYAELPEKEDMDDPVYVSYTVFQKKCIREYRAKMVAFLKTFDRDICFDDEDYARIEASTELHRRLPHWMYHASSNCRAILGDGSSGIICSNTSVDYMGYALRDTAVSAWQQKLRLWQNLTNLGALDYYIMSRLDNHLDRSAYDGVREVFDFHRKNENAYLGLRNLGRVLLRREDRWVATEEEKGWIRTLTECHIPFAEILPTQYAAAHLERYDIVILADQQYLTPEEIRVTDAFAQKGGTVLISGGTGLANDRGKRKNVPALACQGLRRVRQERGDMASAIFLIDAKERRYFPSNPSCDAVALGDRYLFMEPEPDTEGLLNMVPVHPFGPPECCYFTEVSSEKAVYLHPYGKGRAVTVPWYPGEFYARTGFDNLMYFMKDVLIPLCGARPLTDTLSPMAEVSLSGRQDGSMLVQMVNNSGIFGMSFVRPVPIEKITLRIPVPGKPKQVRSLHGTQVSWDYREGQLSLMVPCLEEHEAIEIRP